MDQKLPPMQISILDENFVKIAGAVEYQSLMWHRCYYQPGDFLLQVKASDYDSSWAYVYCDDRPETGIIQKVEYDDSYTGPTGDDTVLLSGFFLESILSRLVFLVEESEEQKVVVPKPTRPSYTQPAFFTDKSGNYFVRHTTYSDLGRERKGTYVNCMTGDVVLTDDLPELTEADVTPGDGLTEQTYTNPSGEQYTTGIYSTLYGYVTDGTDKLTVLLANNAEKKSYDIIGDPSSGLVLYKDDDGNVRWVNGVVESKADTYYRKVQSWEHLDEDEDGNRYYYKTVMGPWMLRADLDDVTTPQDNVQWVLKMAQKIFGSNFIYDEPTFSGETKTLSPSLTYVGDYFYNELKSVEASLRVFYHYESDAMVFQLWQGIDRTQDQSSNPWAVFSDTWGTLTGFAASHDTSNYRNKCYVLYEYDEPVWDATGHVKVTTTAEFDENGSLTGRKYVTSTTSKRGYLTVRLEDDREDMEVWLDERGEQPDFMDEAEFGEFDSEPSYSFTKVDFDAWAESLKAEGETLLKTDYGDVDQLDTGTLSAGDYLTGWDLGDKVDMEASVVGMVKTARITEVEETYESGKSDVKITIGDELLTTAKRSRLT